MELYAYIYGDVTTVTRILSQVAMIFDGNAFLVAAKIAAIIGIIVALLGGLMRGAMLPVSAFFWPILVAVLMILPRVDLVIEDRAGGLARIDGLPVGFAAPISIITQFGNGISQMLTENLGLDSNAVTMDNGHLVALRAPIVYQQVITDDGFQGDASQFADGLSPTKDTLNYVMTCLAWDAKNPSATNNALHQLQIRQISTLRVSNAAPTVATSNGQTWKCGDLFDQLMSDFESSDYQTKLNSAINKYFSKYEGDTTTAGRYQTALENLVTEKSDFYKAAAFSSALRWAPAMVAETAGGGSSLAALNDALNQKREKNFGAAAVVFETISHTIAFIEVWSFSILPLVLLLLMIGGVGAKIGTKYFWMLAWVQLWYPTILIVIGYMDAATEAAAISNTETVAGFNAFIAEILRLQDVGYMNLSMATALSMMLVMGMNNSLSTSMQRDMSGGDHYDPKKNAPDSLSRAPAIQFQSAFQHSAAAGYTGTDAARAFNGATFFIETTTSTGRQQASAEALQVGSRSETGTAVTSAETTSRRTGVQDVASTSASRSAGKDVATGLSFGQGASVTGSIGDNSSDSTQYSQGHQVNAGVNGSAAFGLGKSAGSGNAGGSLGANAGYGFRLGKQETQGQQSSLTFGQSLEDGARRSSSGTARRSEDHSESESSQRSTGQDVADSMSHQDTVSTGMQIARTSGETDTATTGVSTSSGARIQVDGIIAANQIARNAGLMSVLQDAVSNEGLQNKVDEWMDHNKDRLDATFYGREAEDAKFAFAATWLMQGMGGPLFAGEDGQARMASLNEISDTILANSGYTQNMRFEEGATINDLNKVSETRPEELVGQLGTAFKGYELTREQADAAVAATPLNGDMDTVFASLSRGLGADLEQLAPGQLNGIVAGMRRRMDAELGPMSEDQQNFMQLFRDTGFVGALQNTLWKDNMSVRREEVMDAYDGAVEHAIGATSLRADDLAGNNDAVASFGSAMLDDRMSILKGAGVATEDDNVGRFLALKQLEAGAHENGHTELAGFFSAESAKLIHEDSVFADRTTSARMEAFAMTGANEGAMRDSLLRANQEYRIGRFEQALEGRTGLDLNSEGRGVDWGVSHGPSSLHFDNDGAHGASISLSANDRDIAIRTVLGEAAGEAEIGQVAVAQVLRNRFESGGYGASVADVALAPKQFSAWNSGAGGNHLVNKYGPGDKKYEQVGALVDAVFSGAASDPTNGATHYFSPKGMEKLVAEGDQSNLLPRWLEDKRAESGGATEIGGHIFVGRA